MVLKSNFLLIVLGINKKLEATFVILLLQVYKVQF